MSSDETRPRKTPERQPSWLVEPTDERMRMEERHRHPGPIWAALFIVFVVAMAAGAYWLLSAMVHHRG